VLEGDPMDRKYWYQILKGSRIVEQSQVLKIWENYITVLHDISNRPVTLEVKPQEKLDADEKSTYILQ
jgi:hypothetical protein